MTDATSHAPIVVQKFGGSSVATVEKLKMVAEKIVATRRSGKRVVVVVSAMGNTTNELLAQANAVSAAPSRRELDMLLSVGERISMSLLSMAIHDLGCEAISFTGSQVGIITNDSHANAQIIDVRPFRIQDELERDRIVIVAGFQGTSYKREITTLGRGGSDMTAVALAGALGAPCEIYSDVDGVYSSDPRVVLDAERLLELSADEMLTLARQGASVLHAEAVAYSRKKRIALHARSTHDASSIGTIVRPDGWPDQAQKEAVVAPVAVASHEKTLVVEAEARVLGQIEDLATRSGADVLGVTTSEQTMRLVLTLENCHDLAVFDGLEAACRTDLSSVALVGSRLGSSPKWIRRVVDTLANDAVDVVSLWTNEHAITVLVDREQRAQSMRALHQLVPR